MVINRTVEEFEKGHVDAEKIINIPYMFNTPEGERFVMKFFVLWQLQINCVIRM